MNDGGNRPNPQPLAPLPLPRQFEDYELLQQIGQGGMGVIYKARQCCLNRLCALKMLHSRLPGEDQRESSLMEEATLAGSLDHPNIVAVYEVGRGEGRLFFSMEYVAGEDLGRYCRSRVLRAAEVARLAQKIADAVAYAHGRGVMHHDLKPANVVIDKQGEPQITDFGLARRVDSVSRLHPTDGVGSPNYMAPEQASARFGDPGLQTDVFGIGTILYYMLTDRPPFRGETVEDTLRAVLEMDPIPPRRLRPGVPLDLETICLKCLNKQPARRYQSVREVAQELARFRNNEPIRARPAGPAERVWMWRRRHPTVSVLGAVIVLLLGAVTVVSLASAVRIDKARARAQASEQATRHSLYAADMLLASEALSRGNEARVREILGLYAPVGDGPDLRGWEWRFMQAASQGDEQCTLGSHRSAVGLAEVTKDGRHAITSDSLGGLTVWDLSRRQAVATKQSRDAGTTIFAFSRSQDTVAVSRAAPDGTNSVVMLLAFADLQMRREFGVPGPGRPLQFGPEDKTIWLVGRDELTEVELSSGRQLKRFPITPGGVLDHAISPDNRWAASGEEDGTIVLWDTTSGRPAAKFSGHVPNPVFGRAIQHLTFSPDGRLLASCGSDGVIRLWERGKRLPAREIGGHADVILSVAFSGDGRRLASVGRDAFVQVSDLSNDTPPIRLRTGGAIQLAASFLPDNETVLTGGLDGRVRLWNQRPHELFHTLTNLPPQSAGAILLEDRRHFAVYDRDNGVTVRQLSDGAVIHRLEGSTNLAATWVTAGEDEKFWAAMLSFDRNLVLRRLPDGLERRHAEALKRPPPRNSSAVGVTASRDGRYLAAWDLYNGLRLWKTDPWLLAQSAGASPASARFSPRGKWFVLGELTGRVRLWRIPSCEPAPFELFHSQLSGIEFSMDETQIATAGFDGVARIWRLSDGRLTARLPSTGVGMVALAWTPDGSRLAGGSLDGAVCVWDLVARRQNFTYHAHEKVVESLGFLPDGSLASLSPESVLVWPIRAKTSAP